ncbi:cyclic nucleotide-binding-like protein [Leucosporidium creatinivorum]|uniref:cAMP-dependent protein kinase regulatory subunit n=1 Tax=Leucosporidium creatinivorum TaxID=106004 RepID=A0A1Y2FJF8_9BASI|nr:cyclic nucleotide-binding-like protein [Leucosporidium creatinivorum]
MRDTTPPHSAKALPGQAVGPASPPPQRKSTPPSLVGQGYTFGGPRTIEGDNKPSPFSEFPPSNNNGLGSQPPSPFTRAGDRTSQPPTTTHPTPLTFGAPLASPGANRSAFASRSPPPAPLALGSRDSKASNDEDESDEEEVDDPRDDPNYHPSKNNNGFGGGLLGGPGNHTGGIPSTYNLGRRTSVSAESLDPNQNTSNLPKTVIAKSASQRERIEASIANNLLFRNLDEDQHTDVLNAMKEVSVNKGTEVIVQGAVGDFFYVVEEGTFEVWVRGPPTHTYSGPGQTTTVPGEEKKVATYGPGGSFGELALMYNAPRAATVVATSRATMWALDRVTFRSILMEHTSRKRKMYENFLAEVPILASLNTKERAKIADALEEKVYEEGESVVVEGEVGKNFYIIESGKAEVSRRRKASGPGFDEEILGSLSKGDYFGELALLNSAPRAATVRAQAGQGRLRVATLGEKAFTRLLGPVIDLLQRKAQNEYGGSSNPSGQQQE